MDMAALFKVQCGLFIASVEFGGKRNGCITNTLMQQSHVPVKFAVTLEKKHLTHELILQKGSLAASVLAKDVPVPLVKHFGFQSGRDVEKFTEEIPFEPDCNGNPLPQAEAVAAWFALRVYQQVDIGTHTLFLCTVDDMKNLSGEGITYSDYRSGLKK